jgi:DUF917 family protein
MIGATLLSSGGGGSIGTGRMLANLIKGYYPQKSVDCIEPNDVEDDAKTAVVAIIGSPLELEKMKIHDGPKRAFDLLIKETFGDCAGSYTVPIETGCVNMMIPMLVSIQKGIPIIDGDGGGRSFPKVALATFREVRETAERPTVVLSEDGVESGGTEAIAYQKDIEIREDIIRSIIISKGFNSCACLGCFPMEGRDLNYESAPIVKNTVTRSRYVGQLIRESLERGLDPSDAIVSKLGGYKLATGKIESISMPETGSFDIATVTISCEKGKVFVLGVNESILALASYSPWPLAMAPDLICYMGENGPLSNPDLTVDQNVTLIGLKADAFIRESPFRDRYMKECFALGYKGPYIPIENLHKISNKEEIA